MKTFLILFLLILPVFLYAAYAPGTVAFLPLSTDLTDVVGTYTWTSLNNGFETKDGFACIKFADPTAGYILSSAAITDNILTVTFDVWISSTKTSDFRLFSTNGPNQGSIQYYSGNSYLYNPAGTSSSATWTSVFTEDTWVNVGYTLNVGSNTTSLYVDNVIKQTHTCGSSLQGYYFTFANVGWAWSQTQNTWFRNARLMTVIPDSFPVVDPPDSSPTFTPTITPTVTATVTTTITATVTATVTTTITATVTPTLTITQTFTPSATKTVTQTFTPSATPTVTNVLIEWKQLNSSASFPARGFAGYTIFDNKAWIMGGGKCDFVTCDQFNDVWYSSDGIDWYLATGNAAFGLRRRCVVFNYNNYMYIAGGVNNGGTYLKDVWRSADGIDWSLVTGNAAWGDPSIVGGSGGRIPAVSQGVVYDNKMWIMSGQVQDVGCVADIWYSSNGADWYAATRDAAFIGRSGGSGIYHNNNLYISGGATCAGGTSQICYRSSDGSSWTQTDDIAATHMQHHNMLSYKNFLWVFGGSTANPGPDVNTVKHSSDGTNWVTDVTGYIPARGAYCTVILKNHILIYSGYANEELGQTNVTPLNDVWRAEFYLPVLPDTYNKNTKYKKENKNNKIIKYKSPSYR